MYSLAMSMVTGYNKQSQNSVEQNYKHLFSYLCGLSGACVPQAAEPEVAVLV